MEPQGKPIEPPGKPFLQIDLAIAYSQDRGLSAEETEIVTVILAWSVWKQGIFNSSSFYTWLTSYEFTKNTAK